MGQILKQLFLIEVYSNGILMYKIVVESYLLYNG